MSARATVLVVDDELGMREMLSYELSQEGFEVETAENGMAAVEAVKRRRFDLAVTDLKMPGLDGVATVEALRSLDPDLEVIVGTGYATVETAVACMKRGAYDYIQKPYDLAELKLLLDRAMQKSHLQGVVALYEASRALLGTLKHSELVQLVLGLAQRVLRADHIGLLLWRDGTDQFALHRSVGGVQPPAGLFLELGRSVAGSGAPLRVPSPTATEVPQGWDAAGYGSALVYPLTGKDRCLGALALLRREGSPAYVQSELQRGNVFANQLALSLDNARLYEDLEGKVRELVATRDQLIQAEKLALAGHLAGAVAHEINNPLAFVRANLDALRDYSSTMGALWLAAKGAALYLRQLPGPEAIEQARRLRAAGGDEERTESMVRDIAEVIDETLEGIRRIADLVAGFTRLAEPAEAAAPERVPVGDLVDECLAALSQTQCPERRNRAVQREVPVDCETLACREDLRSAVLNILAYLCSPDLAGRSEGAVHLTVREEAGRPLLLISDASLHLSPEERGRLFDPRVEVDTRQGRTMRLNLSLALAHQLLSRNGAQISVEGSERDGVRFLITLPAAGR